MKTIRRVSTLSAFKVGAVDAFLYNIVAGWIGGLQIELSESAVMTESAAY